MTLGEKLKHLRQDKSLTQKDLADKLHVSFQTISKWENGENEPDISTLRELAKLFDCSVDYLINEDETEREKVTEESNTPVVESKDRRICTHCGKEISGDDFVVTDQTKHERHGRFSRTVVVGHNYYHKECFSEIEAKRKEHEQQMKAAHAKKAKKWSFFWGIFGGSIALIATLLGLLLGAKSINPGISVLLSILAGYGIFSMLYCIISGSYIGDVFVWCAGLSIKFPGLIFSWDLEGFAWLIAMKILFAVLGFLVGVFALMFAIAFSAVLGMISFPFVLIHNIHTQYEDSLV